MSGIWRYRCPEGHAALRTRTRSPGYYCKTCNEGYPGDPLDAKHNQVNG